MHKRRTGLSLCLQSIMLLLIAYPQSLSAFLIQPYVSYVNPTIYFTHVIDKFNCIESNLRKIYNAKTGAVIMQICASDLRNCRIEGACLVDLHEDEKDNQFILMYSHQKNSKDYFSIQDTKRCPWGLGVNNICLDPFFTVAADLSYHKAGDVIFVEELVGMQLPTGEIHNGYFIVRDRGQLVKGYNRFDFFTGTIGFNDDNNPYKKIGLGGLRNKFTFVKITDPDTILTAKISRNYPEVPKDLNSQDLGEEEKDNWVKEPIDLLLPPIFIE